MLNKTSMLLAAAVVALSAGAASADDSNHRGDRSGANVGGASNQPVYGSGYNYGYDDGYARRERNDRFRADPWRAPDRGYQRGAYYYGNDCSGNTAAGTILGAIAGGAIGNQIGHGSGGATFAGVILGGLAGNSLARDVDCNDRRVALTSYSAGFEGRIGERHDWRNGSNYGSFTPVREYSRDGNTCRDFREASTRRGQGSSRNGTACRHTDGNWYFD
ncbi:MAG: RT0821/Lpp0805 family surface protein [Rhizomicrobium sp.]